MEDVIVIGAGVVGCSIARSLSRYDLKVRVLEAGSDVAEGATKANSSIVHAGFDAKPGTNKAKFNLLGNKMFARVCAELKVPFVQNGSLVLAFSEEDKVELQKLLERGRSNGVEGLEILDQAALRAREPNVSEEAVAALWAPTGGICCPYDLTFRTAENAAANGVEFTFDARVCSVEKINHEQTRTGTNSFWRIACENGRTFEAKAVVNAAGVHSDELNNLVNPVKYNIQPRRGEYYMLDRSEGNAFKATIFQVPGPMGKGILVSPTVDGTVIVGPSSEDIADKEDKATTAEIMAKVTRLAKRSFPALPVRAAIKNFSGIRAHETTVSDFVLGEPEGVPGFFNALGVESPGLTSAPAIGEFLAEQVAARLGAAKKPAESISDDVSYWPKTREMTPEALAEQVKKDPTYGRIICRCETVTEGEIRAAIRARVGARTLDGIKRRTRSGMGRCQGGFCTPRLLEILSQELGLPMEAFLESRAKAPEGSVKGKVEVKVKVKEEGKETGSGTGNSPAVDVLVIGAGPAGLAAAIAAREAGCENVLILERDDAPGGILQQCIHNGFGLHRFKEELTGPEYAHRFIDKVNELKIPIECRTMVLDVSADHAVTTISPVHGMRVFKAKSIVLAMGCRERPRGALLIPGTRPAGVFTAGTAQRLVNMEGIMPGKRVVILGSGDIGLIMARRMTFQGAKVLACVELMPYSSGLKRNIVQCLDDYGIPLLLSHTVVDIQGRDHLTGVTVAQVDDKRQPIPGTEQHFDCDTLLLSVGLLPENELSKTAGVALSPVTGGAVVDDSMQTSVPGVFACGNVLHVHDLVDYVSAEAEIAGRSAAAYAADAQERVPPAGGAQLVATAYVQVKDGFGVRGTVPQRINPEGDGKVAVSFRPAGVYKDAAWVVRAGDEVLCRRKSRILTPGESQRVEIDRALFKGKDEVIVEVVK